MRIAYVCEGGGDLGWGHVSRGRSLWEAHGASLALVVGRGLTEVETWARDLSLPLPLVPWRSADAPLEPSRGEYDVLIVDDYGTDGGWIESASGVLPTVVVDDWMRSSVRATALLNQNVGAQRADYPAAVVREWLLGPEYCLLRGEVRAVDPLPLEQGIARNVLLTLGGSDPHCHVAELAAALIELPWYAAGGRLTVVLGPSYRGVWPSRRWLETAGRVEVCRSPQDFTARCASADLVVCSASTTTYELAYLGRPFVPVALVDNQARVASRWSERGVGPGVGVWDSDWLGRVVEEVDRLASSGAVRAARVEITAGLVDGRGVERVLRVCRALHDGWRAA